MRVHGLILLTLVGSLGITSRVLGAGCCPFCDAPSLTLSEQVDQSSHLLLGKWLGGEKPTADTAGTSTFMILEVAKSDGDLFKVGEEFELPQYIAGDLKAKYILMGPDKLIDWHVPSEATDSGWNYISKLPAPVVEQQQKIERLAYFLDYLQHPELTVANDAYAEFAAAPYEIITPLSDRMPRGKTSPMGERSGNAGNSNGALRIASGSVRKRRRRSSHEAENPSSRLRFSAGNRRCDVGLSHHHR